MQSDPSVRHSPPEHTPALHPSAQQSLAREQLAPAGLHCGMQLRAELPLTGSHRPLQQSVLDEQDDPAPAHAPGGAQVFEAQCVEQQSDALPQGSPSARQAVAGADASQTGGLASPRKRDASSPASPPSTRPASVAASPCASSMSSAPQATMVTAAPTAIPTTRPFTGARAPCEAPPPGRPVRSRGPGLRGRESVATARRP